MTLEAVRSLRETHAEQPILLLLQDGRQLLLDSGRYLGVTPKGVVLAVARGQTLFLVPEQIKEARTGATAVG